jgi:hypothetical protein
VKLVDERLRFFRFQYRKLGNPVVGLVSKRRSAEIGFDPEMQA